MGNLGTFIKGAPLSKADITDEGTPFVLYGELYTTYGEVTHSIKRRTDKVVEPQFYSKVGDVIMPTSGETPEDIATASCIMLPDVILAGDLLIYRTQKVDGRLVSFVVKNKVNKQISSVAQGKSVVHVRAEELSKISISYPSDAEQQKILTMLELLEDKMAKQRELIEHLKKYKRGVSNTFFNDKVVAECSAVLPFGQAVEINPKTKSLPTEFIYIDLESVESGKLLQENIISRDNAPSRAQRVLTKGDVLFQMVRPYQKNNFYFESELSLPAVASTGYAQIRCVDNDPLFVFEQISSDYFANEAMLRSTGTGYPAINADSLAEIPFIKHPIEEQRKIGKFLYLLSQRIIQEESKLEALLKVKGAMLQSLFI